MADTSGGVAKITGQSIGMGIGADGKPSSGYDLTFMSARGNQGRIFVATKDFTPDRVSALIREQANNLDAVTALEIKQ